MAGRHRDIPRQQHPLPYVGRHRRATGFDPYVPSFVSVGLVTLIGVVAGSLLGHATRWAL